MILCINSVLVFLKSLCRENLCCFYVRNLFWNPVSKLKIFRLQNRTFIYVLDPCIPKAIFLANSVILTEKLPLWYTLIIIEPWQCSGERTFRYLGILAAIWMGSFYSPKSFLQYVVLYSSWEIWQNLCRFGKNIQMTHTCAKVIECMTFNLFFFNFLRKHALKYLLVLWYIYHFKQKFSKKSTAIVSRLDFF